jgi:hypothetical protein
MEDILIKEKAMIEDTLVKEDALPQPEVGKTKVEKSKHSFVDIIQCIGYMLPIAIGFCIIVSIIGGSVASKAKAISDCIENSSGAACAEYEEPSESVSPTVETDFRK